MTKMKIFVYSMKLDFFYISLSNKFVLCQNSETPFKKILDKNSYFIFPAGKHGNLSIYTNYYV